MNELNGKIYAPPELRAELGASGTPGPPGPAGETPYIGENGNWWIGDKDTGTPASVGDHGGLQGRDQPDQHPIDAINGLREVVDNLPVAMTADELRKILMNGGNKNAR